MSEVPSFEAGRLAANARLYKYDPVLDAAADLFESDPAAWHYASARACPDHPSPGCRAALTGTGPHFLRHGHRGE